MIEEGKSMSREVIIIGAGGHAKVVADIILKSGDSVLGFLDDSVFSSGSFCGFPIIGKVKDYERFNDRVFVIAIGNSQVREKIADELKGVRWYTAVHPDAVLSDLDVSIDEGTVIMANAVINPGAHIGRHCIVNTGAIIEHDNKIGDYSHISVGAKSAGTVSIGRHVWIGAGATISNNISICSDCMIGAGSVVIRNIEKPGTYIGVPARKIK